jgi:hypothetical protein
MGPVRACYEHSARERRLGPPGCGMGVCACDIERVDTRLREEPAVQLLQGRGSRRRPQLVPELCGISLAAARRNGRRRDRPAARSRGLHHPECWRGNRSPEPVHGSESSIVQNMSADRSNGEARQTSAATARWGLPAERVELSLNTRRKRRNSASSLLDDHYATIAMIESQATDELPER